MPTLVKRLEPHCYPAFHCIGAACEDTCCAGWIVNIDKQTYDTYQNCDDPEFAPRMQELITINTSSTSDEDFARITLSGAECAFMTERLCGIQNKFGEDFLSLTCATYPRNLNAVDDVLERSLDFSCPEAARIVLLDPKPMEFDLEDGPLPFPRLGRLPILNTQLNTSVKPYPYFHDLRRFVIWLLQHRAGPLWQRLVILAAFCDQLEELSKEGMQAESLDLIALNYDAVNRGLFEEALNNHEPQPREQLELVLDLIVARLGFDVTSPRFRECYQDFMKAMEWTNETTMNQLAGRYTSAAAQYYAPFMNNHEYILEHYLVTYVYRTLFPLGAQPSDRPPGPDRKAETIREHCLLMLAHYAIMQTVLIGAAAFYKEEFSTRHVIKVIQSFSKTFEHSTTFPGRALHIIADKGVANCASLAFLIRT